MDALVHPTAALPEGVPVCPTAALPEGSIGDMIAAEAERWDGTPFRWQGRVKGVGVDCKGLIAGVLAACGRPEGQSVEALAGDYRDGRFEPVRLRRGLARLFDQVEAVEAGDILLLVVRGAAQHLAICSAAEAGAPRRIVHAYPSIGRVVIASYGSAHRMASAWRCRDLAGPTAALPEGGDPCR